MARSRRVITSSAIALDTSLRCGWQLLADQFLTVLFLFPLYFGKSMSSLFQWVSQVETLCSQMPLKIGWIHQWPLNRKMLVGYSVAFAVTTSGIVVGFSFAHHYEQRARQIETESLADFEAVYQLQSDLLQLLTHQQSVMEMTEDFTSLGGQSASIYREFNHLIEQYEAFKESWFHLQQISQLQPVSDRESSRIINGAKIVLIQSLFRTYQEPMDTYFREFDELIAQTQPLVLQPERVALLFTGLLSLNQNSFFSEIEHFTTEVDTLSAATQAEKETATQLRQQAQATRNQILFVSILFSGAIGLLVMYLVSRMLLEPLEQITLLTQQSINQENFDLTVPVQSLDEIGILAQTFNRYADFTKGLFVQQQGTLEALKRTQSQMLQSEKMSSLGQLVAGVAHEINNPVNFIHGNLHHLQEYTQDLLSLVQLYQQHYPHPETVIQEKIEDVDLEFIQEDLPQTLASMKLGSDRIRDIVASLRNFSRMDEAEVKSVHVQEGIENTLMILNHRLKAQSDRAAIRVIKQYAEIPQVECYASLMNQVFMNIFANAIDALEEKCQQYTANPQGDDAAHILVRTSLIHAGEWVEIAIADNGRGIPAAVQKQIFDPFFTTKPIGKGTGMGMSISYQIVTERHGGQLICISTPGQGTEFKIQIPLRQTLPGQSRRYHSSQ